MEESKKTGFDLKLDRAISIVAIVMSAYHLIACNYNIFQAGQHINLHILFSLIIVFLQAVKIKNGKPTWQSWCMIALLAASVVTCLYIHFHYYNFMTALGAQPFDKVFSGVCILLIILIIWLAPAIPVSPLGALLIVIFGFFFSTVSARMVGMIGSSNNPVSGMTIATLLIATMILKATGNVGIEGMIGSMAIASVICICAAIAADTSQDLKTGYLLGATPVKQQIGELIGVVAAGLAIGGVLYLLDSAWGYGGAEVPAPQATLMKMIVEGIMGGNLPWNLVFTGVFLAIALEILRIPVMPFAIGLYLPIYLNTSIMIGGAVRWFMDSRKNVDAATKEEQTTNGTLFCAGMIAGEGLVGILLAIFAVFGISTALSIDLGNIGGVVLMIVMIACLLAFSMKKKKN